MRTTGVPELECSAPEGGLARVAGDAVPAADADDAAAAADAAEEADDGLDCLRQAFEPSL
jgi:hypothetical protein